MFSSMSWATHSPCASCSASSTSVEPACTVSRGRATAPSTVRRPSLIQLERREREYSSNNCAATWSRRWPPCSKGTTAWSWINCLSIEVIFRTSSKFAARWPCCVENRLRTSLAANALQCGPEGASEASHAHLPLVKSNATPSDPHCFALHCSSSRNVEQALRQRREPGLWFRRQACG